MTAADPSSATPPQERAGFLSVLTGAQRGACAPLIQGLDYVLGADESCDLVVWDDSVAPRHLRLGCHAGRLQVGALDSAVVLADRVLSAGTTIECAPGLILRLGEICIGVGQEHQDWSRSAWPETPTEHPPQTAQSHEATDELAAQPETASLADAPEATAPIPPDFSAIQDSGDTSDNDQLHSRYFWISAAAILAGLLLLATLLNGWWPAFGKHPDGTDDPVAMQPDPRAQAQTVLESFPLTDAELTERADGVLVLTGYCESRELKEQITQALNAAGVRVDNRLRPEDRLRAVLAQTLERIGGKRIEHEYQGRGVVHLRGHLPPGLAKEPFLRLLHQDVAGLARVEGDVRSITDLIADLKQRVREAELPLERLEFSAEGQAIRVAGHLNAADTPRWAAAANAFEQAHPGAAPLDVAIDWIAARSVIAPVSAPAEASSRRVIGVLVGADQTAFAVLDDGTRLTTGDRIDGRYAIEEIHFDRVIVFDGGERKTFHVGAK